MSIRFRCDSCGQKLKVSDEKAGLQAKCPKCRKTLTVPAQSAIAEDAGMPGAEQSRVNSDTGTIEPASSEPEEHSPRLEIPLAPVIRTTPTEVVALPEIVIRDDSLDWVNENAHQSGGPETMIDYDKVAVPRRVLYLQGGLLAVVAVTSFILGMLTAGGGTPRGLTSKSPQPCLLSGRITYGGADQEKPDGGSVVIVLPADRRPTFDDRVAIEGLRPGDPLPTDQNISLRTIRSWGGDFVRANDEGNYQIRLPEQGRYHVLMISHRAARSGSEKLETTDVAQMGRYFSNTVQLLDDRKYRWRTLTLRGQNTLDATF